MALCAVDRSRPILIGLNRNGAVHESSHNIPTGAMTIRSIHLMILYGIARHILTATAFAAWVKSRLNPDAVQSCFDLAVPLQNQAGGHGFPTIADDENHRVIL